MELPDEIKAHQRMEREKKKGKVGSGKVESPDELQDELIKKSGKGTSLGWSRQAS
jgi:hypothetical protein